MPEKYSVNYILLQICCSGLIALYWKALVYEIFDEHNNRKQANQNPREEINLKEIECSK